MDHHAQAVEPLQNPVGHARGLAGIKLAHIGKRQDHRRGAGHILEGQLGVQAKPRRGQFDQVVVRQGGGEGQQQDAGDTEVKRGAFARPEQKDHQTVGGQQQQRGDQQEALQPAEGDPAVHAVRLA